MSTAETPPAAYDAHMEAIWAGTACGYSEHQLIHGLGLDRRLLADLNAHRITPRRIIGSGVRREMSTARAYLTDRIADGVDQIATRGRSNPVNQSNTRYALATGTFSPSTYQCDCTPESKSC